jgi:protease-4
MRNVKLCVAFIAFMLVIPVSGLAKKGKVLKIDFKNPISEYGHRGNSFDIMSIVNQSKPSVSLLSYVRAIDAAAEDKKVEMIYMTPDKISAGLSQIEELRAAFERFRESGKQIVAYCGTFSNGSYYLASVADKIILDPASESFITGLATQQIFLKDILDTLGVDVQIIRHGKYKSAGEMFVRNTSSPENRRQYEALMNSLWNSMCSEIAASRGFTAEASNRTAVQTLP